jgi:hypothetical protein
MAFGLGFCWQCRKIEKTQSRTCVGRQRTFSSDTISPEQICGTSSALRNHQVGARQLAVSKPVGEEGTHNNKLGQMCDMQHRRLLCNGSITQARQCPTILVIVVVNGWLLNVNGSGTLSAVARAGEGSMRQSGVIDLLMCRPTFLNTLRHDVKLDPSSKFAAYPLSHSGHRAVFENQPRQNSQVCTIPADLMHIRSGCVEGPGIRSPS